MNGHVLFNLFFESLESGAPVYMYQFEYTYTEIQKMRPSFVGSDHGDEILFVFGTCFFNGHIKMTGK